MTPKQERFVAEYLVDLNATQAAIRAGYSARSAKVTACDMLHKPEIAEAVREARAKQIAAVGEDAEEILRELWRLVRADANELIEHRRVCCRHCYGVGHRYQCTPAEREKRYTAFLRLIQAAMADVQQTDDGANVPVPQFDELGGVGYSTKRDPHPDCPECHGEGLSLPFAKDTRKLSPAARALYAGIKAKPDGSIEVLQHSKDKAIELLGRHYGHWNEPKVSTPEGPGLTVVVQNAVHVEGNRVTSAQRVAVALPEPE